MNRIKSWSISDRPREKLMEYGRSFLTDSELLALIIGNGFKDNSAVSLGRELLKKSENNLNILAKSSLDSLMDCKGIGEAKAISIIAAFELGRRRDSYIQKKDKKINSSNVAYSLIRSKLMDLPHEEMWVLLLNRSNQLIGKELIGKGGISATYADIRILYQKAISKFTTSIILAHNHPSGNLLPSESDIKVTKKIKEAGKLLDIDLLDHLIIGDNAYFSFSDEGMI